MQRLISATLFATALLTAGAASASTYWVQHGVTLNARSGPGTNYHVKGKFTPCARVHVVAYKHGWAKISYNHQAYWVSAKYLQNKACGGHAPKKKYGY